MKLFPYFALGLFTGLLIIGAALAFAGVVQSVLRPWLGLGMSLSMALGAVLTTAALVWSNPYEGKDKTR